MQLLTVVRRVFMVWREVFYALAVLFNLSHAPRFNILRVSCKLSKLRNLGCKRELRHVGAIAVCLQWSFRVCPGEFSDRIITRNWTSASMSLKKLSFATIYDHDLGRLPSCVASQVLDPLMPDDGH